MKKWAKRGGIAFGVVVLLLLVWGVLIEPRMVNVERERAVIPGLGARWEGAEVAVIADFQLGMWAANTGTVEKAVDRLVGLRPAAVLVAGDLVYKADDRPRELAAKAAELLAPLMRAGIPVLAVLGNHDSSIDVEQDPANPRVAAAVAEALTAGGVRVLQNERVPLVLGTDTLTVVGIGSEWAGESRPREALAGLPAGAPRIVFMHNPASFRQIPAGAAPLAVAGHTHGGQISVPGTPHWSWMALVKDHHIEADGWAEDHEEPGGNQLYVNVGIGFSDVPVRIANRPEITLFALHRPGTGARGEEGR